MITTLTDAWREFEECYGSEKPLRTMDELREAIHACGLRYEEIDGMFWGAVFDPTGRAQDAWALNTDLTTDDLAKHYFSITGKSK